MLIEGGCVMSRNMSQRINEALLLLDFDLEELLDFSEAEIRLISAAVDDQVLDMPDDDHEIQRTYMQRALQRLQTENENNRSTATEQWGKKKRLFSDDGEREY
jgi:hypothetical protein